MLILLIHTDTEHILCIFFVLFGVSHHFSSIVCRPFACRLSKDDFQSGIYKSFGCLSKRNIEINQYLQAKHLLDLKNGANVVSKFERIIMTFK